MPNKREQAYRSFNIDGLQDDENLDDCTLGNQIPGGMSIIDIDEEIAEGLKELEYDE